MELNTDHQQTVAFAIMRMSELEYCTQSAISWRETKEVFFGDANAKKKVFRESFDDMASTLGNLCLDSFSL